MKLAAPWLWVAGDPFSDMFPQWDKAADSHRSSGWVVAQCWGYMVADSRSNEPRLNKGDQKADQADSRPQGRMGDVEEKLLRAHFFELKAQQWVRWDHFSIHSSFAFSFQSRWNRLICESRRRFGDSSSSRPQGARRVSLDLDLAGPGVTSAVCTF